MFIKQEQRNMNVKQKLAKINWARKYYNYFFRCGECNKKIALFDLDLYRREAKWNKWWTKILQMSNCVCDLHIYLLLEFGRNA